jgi:hypothetical protein
MSLKTIGFDKTLTGKNWWISLQVFFHEFICNRDISTAENNKRLIELEQGKLKSCIRRWFEISMSEK